MGTLCVYENDSGNHVLFCHRRINPRGWYSSTQWHHLFRFCVGVHGLYRGGAQNSFSVTRIYTIFLLKYVFLKNPYGIAPFPLPAETHMCTRKFSSYLRFGCKHAKWDARCALQNESKRKIITLIVKNSFPRYHLQFLRTVTCPGLRRWGGGRGQIFATYICSSSFKSWN